MVLDLGGKSLEELSRRWDSLSGPEAQKLIARNAVKVSDTYVCGRAGELSLQEVLAETSPMTAQAVVDELVLLDLINS